ncbi:MAG: Asp23/Gls24 family envelope stress response protein [Anaerolineae bacterium]|nr:Asp23/Gls24 family envelope stress response protein [Anaerolineae bacterium]
MDDKVQPKGKIEVAPAAIASIVNEAVLTCYGVVGTVPRNFATGLVDMLYADRKRGVEVQVNNGEIIIDVFAVLQYGTRVSTVAESIKHVVKYQVEKSLEMPVAAVNVHIQALRVSDTD